MVCTVAAVKRAPEIASVPDCMAHRSGIASRKLFPLIATTSAVRINAGKDAMPDISPLAEGDLAYAQRISRLAFGTFLGAPEAGVRIGSGARRVRLGQLRGG